METNALYSPVILFLSEVRKAKCERNQIDRGLDQSFLKHVVFLGCGRFFEGNAKEMNKALNEVLAYLPDDTKVYVSISVSLLFSPFLFLLLGIFCLRLRN